jgi:predicted phosphodiesterase
LDRPALPGILGAEVRMRVAVVSDLHLGRGDAAERFGHDDEHFLRFLDFLEGEFERVVLLGDVWETLTSPNPRAQAEELRACRRAHPRLAERFGRDKYLYIHGNHDLVARRVEHAPSEWTLEHDGLRVLLIHGHVLDVFNQRTRGLSELGSWAGGWLMRLGLRGLVRQLDHMDHVLGGASVEPSCAFQQRAVALARIRDADVIVTGHTHLGGRSDHGDRMVLNSGTCSWGEWSFVEIDTRQGHFAWHDRWPDQPQLPEPSGLLLPA